MDQQSINELLRDHFTKDEPLGPTQAFRDVDEASKEVFTAYFDAHNYPFKQLSKNPTMIVGRRGSGKTDALLSYPMRANKVKKAYKPIVYFEASKAATLFDTLVTKISSQVHIDMPRPMVEAVSLLWSNIFWTCVFSAIVSENPKDDSKEKIILASYIAGFGIPPTQQDPYQIALKVVLKYQELFNTSYSESGLNLFSVLPIIQVSEVSNEDAHFAALSWLKNNSQQAIILFDSFEELNLNNLDNKLAIAAFLKAVGEFQQPGVPVDMRCCIPAEIYFLLLEVSSNAMKDFKRTNILQWTAGELLRLAAIRYQKFIELWYPEEFSKLIKPFPLDSRSSVTEFWNQILPATVPNTRKDQRERTIPYILRHTQLLPRQILAILNNILSTHVQTMDRPDKVDSDIVRSQINETEAKLVTQIISSYSKIWPEAESQIKKVLSNFGSNIVSYGAIHSAMNQSGIKGQGGIHDQHDLFKLLSELGVIGRLTKKSTEYATGVFEYSRPHKINFNAHDMICIHPLFTEVYSVISTNTLPEDYLPVKPMGADPDYDGEREKEEWY